MPFKKKQHQQQQRSTTKKQQHLFSPSTTAMNNTAPTMTLSLLQRCTKAINYLVSFQESAPFLLPTPADAKIYHNKVKRPMDFTTLERNLYSQQHYSTFYDFESDLYLIWNNVLALNKVTTPIHKKALALRQRYEEMNDMDSDHLNRPAIPVEVVPPKQASSSPPLTSGEERPFYMTIAVLPQEKGMDQRFEGFSPSSRALYDGLNGPLFQWLQQEQQQSLPYPRLYINKPRSVLKEAATRAKMHPHLRLAILWNTSIEPFHNDQWLLLTTHVTLAAPLGVVHPFYASPTTNDNNDDDDNDDYAPKAWVKLNPLNTTTYRRVQLLLSKSMAKLYFGRAYTTHRIIANEQQHLISRLIECISTGKSNVTPPPENTQDNQDDDMEDDHNEEEDDENDTQQQQQQQHNDTPVEQQPEDPYTKAMTTYREHTAVLFDDLKGYARSKGVPVVDIKKYLTHTTVYANAEGYFKQVRYVKNNKDVVVQTFRRMTTSQRMIELVGLLKLKGLAHMADIIEVLETNGQVSGLSMQRYQRTLKQYTHAHTHHRLSAHQKMDLIRQMLLCLQVIHQHGLAHRDISEVNFMVDEAPHKILDDGSVGANVYLIDFGKAVFTRPEDVRRWWIEPVPTQQQQQQQQQQSVSDKQDEEGGGSLGGGSDGNEDDYEGEVIPKTKDELETWCKQLPLVSVKPDHGYRCYRSIQTLPRNRTDHAVLPWLVDPVAEDMYSIAALIWKVFAETEPWHGILDSDLKGLRERVEDDERIETQIGREVSGEVSKQLLLSCLKTQPQDRFSATQLLAWIDQPHVTQQLLDEWTLHAPTQRKKRHKKSVFRFEEEQAQQLHARAERRKENSKRKRMEEKIKVRVEKQRKKEEERVRRQQQQQQQQQEHMAMPPMPPMPFTHQQQPMPFPHQQQPLGGPPPSFYGYPFHPFYQPGGMPFPPFYPPPFAPLNQQQQQQQSALMASYIPPPPPPPRPPIRFKPPVTSNPSASSTYGTNRLQAYVSMISRPSSSSSSSSPSSPQNVPSPLPPPTSQQHTQQHLQLRQQKLTWTTPALSTTGEPQPHILLPSPTSPPPPPSPHQKKARPSAYVPTGRPVGRPKGSVSAKRRYSQQTLLTPKATIAKDQPAKRSPGRPKGSKNKRKGSY